MAPPPATPTPHRFLVPKRSQPRTETPKPAFQPSGQQFQATPRFSLHSTPRTGPPSSFTPFPHRSAGRDIVIDSSPPPLRGVDHVDDDDDDDDHHIGVDDGYERGRVGYEKDSVIDDDDVVQESSPIREVESDDENRDGDEERRPKRRRISVSSPGLGMEESSSLPEVEGELDVEMRDEDAGSVRDAVLDIESSLTEPSISGNNISLGEEVPGDDIENFRGIPHYQGKQPSTSHQPTFQKAPRFKPTEIPEGAPYPEPLPDAFSPRRKGTKYIPGGLAAELRDWLVDVEAGSTAGSTAKRDEEWVARIQVDELRGGHGSARDMTLVLGRQVLDGRNNTSGEGHGQGESANTGEEAEEVLGTNTVRVILAGPGRLSGLGVGNDVTPGVILGIARPTWEVVLDGLGRWGVACDWVLLR
ncbi:hypothetical protein HD806DRAFT_352101 [Xylariaceae sp. AK1471]|nr:hypothetical protein HD806DRAFT_352101 [Xylariaceae sp. AK1471]